MRVMLTLEGSEKEIGEVVGLVVAEGMLVKYEKDESELVPVDQFPQHKRKIAPPGSRGAAARGELIPTTLRNGREGVRTPAKRYSGDPYNVGDIVRKKYADNTAGVKNGERGVITEVHETGEFRRSYSVRWDDAKIVTRVGGTSIRRTEKAAAVNNGATRG